MIGGETLTWISGTTTGSDGGHWPCCGALGAVVNKPASDLRPAVGFVLRASRVQRTLPQQRAVCTHSNHNKPQHSWKLKHETC